MLIRRWEVRARDLNTMEDIEISELPNPQFIFRRRAENLCRYQNCVRLVHGFKNWTYYIHDRRVD